MEYSRLSVNNDQLSDEEEFNVEQQTLHPSENSELGRVPHSNPFLNNLTNQEQEMLQHEKKFKIISFIFFFTAGIELLLFTWFTLSAAWFYLICIPLMVVGILGVMRKNRSYIMIFNVIHGLITLFFFLILFIFIARLHGQYRHTVILVNFIICLILFTTEGLGIFLFITLNKMIAINPNYENDIRNLTMNHHPHYHQEHNQQQQQQYGYSVQMQPVQMQPVQVQPIQQNYPQQNVQGYPVQQQFGYPVQVQPIQQNYPQQNYPQQNVQGYPVQNVGYSVSPNYNPPSNVYVVQPIPNQNINPNSQNNTNIDEERLVDLRNN